MPKFRVIQCYTHSEVFEVEALNEDDAVNIVNGSEPPKPDFVTGTEFADEYVELIEGDDNAKIQS